MNSVNKLTKLPTIEQLNNAWEYFLKVGIYDDLRFGQAFYNEYDYEVDNSYWIERPYQAYQLLYNSLVTTLDDVLGEDKQNES